MKPHYNTFQEFFESITLNESTNVIKISSTETLEEGFLKLSSNNILSAPVFDENEKKYVGFLDMRDLVSSVVFIAQNTQEYESTKTLKDLLVNAKWVGGTYTVTYLSRRNKFIPVKKGTNMYEVVKLLGSGKVKRVPVVDEEGNVIRIISQSTVISLVNQHIKEIKDPKMDQTVVGLLLGSAPCVSVNQNSKTIDVFKTMDSHSFSGLALVDDNNRLVGNISSRDIKAFVKKIDFQLLQSPVGEFIKHLRQTVVDISHPTITCFEHTHFHSIVEKLTATKVHRIFVVNNEEHFSPVRVVSIQDTLGKMI